MVISSFSLKECTVGFTVGVSLLLLVRFLRKYVPRYFSPLRLLRGPPSQSFVYGNMMQAGFENSQLHRQWVEQYGTSFRVGGLFLAPRLWTIDPRVINHILTHSMDYFKPLERRAGLARFLGRHSVLVTEGEKHRQQRRIMNPAFGPAQIRELTEVFFAKSNDLCTYWNAQIIDQGGCLRTNVIEGLSKMTLDVIGLAGFNYRFEALNQDLPPNKLNQIFHEIFKRPPKQTIIANLRNTTIPLLRDARTKKVDEVHKAMQEIARQVMAEKKAEIMRECSGKSGTLEKKDIQGRDLLTLLIKANMATDIPENQRMTDEEVLAQVPTFLVAGHETTSTSTTWCLYAITRNMSIQQKLRDELFTVPTDTPSMDVLNALPYLDKVVHETLRLHTPVTATLRIAMRDDILPVSEPYTDRNGDVRHEIRIKKGDRILIPITALHTSAAIWGEDALEFKPERWENPPEAISSIPGVWGHLLTFLGGPHACIGYRFSLIEMKALVFTLVRQFEFELAVPVEEIRPVGFLQRPNVRSEKEKGAQLPLLIRPYTGKLAI